MLHFSYADFGFWPYLSEAQKGIFFGTEFLRESYAST